MKRLALPLALLVAACGGPAPVAPAPVETIPVPPAPTTWTISGRIVSAATGAAIENVTITYGDRNVPAPGGVFAIVTTDSSTKPLVIAAPGYLTRETSLTGGEARSGVLFDLLGTADGFPLQMYLDEVRNVHERPDRAPEPSRHWTANPNFYIRTVWKDTGVPLREESIAFVISELKRLVPQWSGGTLQAGTIDTGTAPRALAQGWITVQYARAGNWARLGENPGEIQFGSEGTCQSLAIAHELGHAMGFWHTRVEPSIMGGGPGACRLFDLTREEALIAKAMYSRAPGNVAPDRDGPPPPPPAYYSSIR